MLPKIRPAATKERSHPQYAYWETLQHFQPDPGRPRCHLLIEPHLLYLTDVQAGSYLNAIQARDYAQRVHNPVVNIIQLNLEQIFGNEQGDFSLIDLGPGYPDMSLLIAKYCQVRSVPVHYYPVDVNDQYLQLAAKNMVAHTSKIVTILARFEDCHAKIPEEAYSRQVYLLIGLTFMNFEPNTFISLLKGIARPRGKVIIASELITDRNSAGKVLASYCTTSAQNFAFGPLANLGLSSNAVNCSVGFWGSRIEFTFTLKQDMLLPADEAERDRCGILLTLKGGDRIITAISYRYALDTLIRILQANFSETKIFLSPDENTMLALMR